MNLPVGVEWALHCCLVLAWLDDAGPVPTSQLATYHGLRPSYLNKQLQALAQAGIVSSVAGVKGGFQLARPPQQIAVLDVVEAIDGPQEPFHCTEIRRCGPNTAAPLSAFTLPCSIAAVMYEAGAAWRAVLAGRTLADIIAAVSRNADGAAAAARTWFTDGQHRGAITRPGRTRS